MTLDSFSSLAPLTTTASILPGATEPASTWDRVGQQSIMTLVILLGAFAMILGGRFLIGRMLSAVAGTAGLSRVLSMRTSPGSASVSADESGQTGPTGTSRRDRRTKTVASLVTNALAVIVSVVSFLMILDVWGFPAAPLLTSVGIVGIAVGFGFQQILRDYLAGFFITVEDQFGIGDLIETSEVKGRVRAMSLRITTVEADDGAIWYLRNGEILRVANHSQGVTTTSLPLTEAPATASEANTAAPTTRIARVAEHLPAADRPHGSPAVPPADAAARSEKPCLADSSPATTDDSSAAKKPLPQKESE